MLQLKRITKNYLSGDNEVKALKGIDLEFREWMWKNNTTKYYWRARQIYFWRLSYKWKVNKRI